MSLKSPTLYWILTPDERPLTAPTRVMSPPPSSALLKRLGQGQAQARTKARLHDWLQALLRLEAIPWAALWLSRYGVPLLDHEQAFLITPVEMSASLNAMSIRPSLIDPQKETFEAWINTIEPLLKESGGALETVEGFTVLRLPYTLDVTTTPLHATLDDDLRDCLPMGRDQKTLRRWMTECQMALHAADIPSVNGVWFWGESRALRTPLKPSSESTIVDPWIDLLSSWHQEEIEVKHQPWSHPALEQALKDDLRQYGALTVALVPPGGEVLLHHLTGRDVLRFWRAPVTIEG